MRRVGKVLDWVASISMILATGLWTYWGAGEMYHEGWWGAWTNRLPYLAPTAITLIPTLIAFRWPIVGGVVIISIGLFAVGFFGSGIAPISILVTLVGAAFLVTGLVKRRHPLEQSAGPPKWWRRDWRYPAAIGLPLVVFAVVSAINLPVVLTRTDDGDRSARLIEGNGVALVWAPQGPGWNWKQPWGGYPSWHAIALYGVPPLGLGDKIDYGRRDDHTYVFATDEDMASTNLCRYLSADGTTLMAEVQDDWRMPTTDEVVRSLGRHGANAGCEWRGEYGEQVACDIRPDKESPLWSTDVPVIYYWTADSHSDVLGTFVAFNGTVSAARKLGGNPRHGYRCVREP
jgi:uncharacterized membrane protein